MMISMNMKLWWWWWWKKFRGYLNERSFILEKQLSIFEYKCCETAQFRGWPFQRWFLPCQFYKAHAPLPPRRFYSTWNKSSLPERQPSDKVVAKKWDMNCSTKKARWKRKINQETTMTTCSISLALRLKLSFNLLLDRWT